MHFIVEFEQMMYMKVLPGSRCRCYHKSFSERPGGKKTSQKKASQKKISRKKASVNKKASHEFYVKWPQ
jgi:hypothetical protein